MGAHPPLLFTDSDLDDLACEFLGSRYAGPVYADWSPIDASIRSCGGAAWPGSPTTAICPIWSWTTS